MAAVLLRRRAAGRAGGARLPARLARRPAVLHAHGPAHAAARHRPDPRDPGPHEGDPAARSRASVATLERRAGPLAHPAFAVVALRGRDLGLAHPRRLRPRRAPRTTVHVLEHLSFLLAGSLYWWHLLSPIRARMRLGGMGPVVYMASTKLFVGRARHGPRVRAQRRCTRYYAHHARVWGISARDDQAIAGLIMAVEQSLVMGIALVVLFIRALGRVRARAATRALRRAPAKPAPCSAAASGGAGSARIPGARGSRRSAIAPSAQLGAREARCSSAAARRRRRVHAVAEHHRPHQAHARRRC